MNKEDRILLIRDVMARLPYNPKFDLNGIIGSIHHINMYTTYSTSDDVDYICSVDFFGDGNYIDIEHFKPCLIPMSMMDEYQRIIYGDLTYAVINSFPDNIQNNIDELYKWLNENDFDYNGLIDKGLAINKRIF